MKLPFRPFRQLVSQNLGIVSHIYRKGIMKENGLNQPRELEGIAQRQYFIDHAFHALLGGRLLSRLDFHDEDSSLVSALSNAYQGRSEHAGMSIEDGFVRHRQ